MIIKTTPEIAEALFEHLLIMKVQHFEIKVSKHKLVNESTKVYFFVVPNSHQAIKIENLLPMYSQLIPNQTAEIVEVEDIDEKLQNYWIPVQDFKISLDQPHTINLIKKVGFGMGIHPSTILALRDMYIVFQHHKIDTIVDVGAGSGILSLYAKKMRIQKIIAFEIQDVAIKTMRKNFRINGYDSKKIRMNPKHSVLEKLDFDKTLFVANMRPSEILQVEDILTYSSKLIISGMFEYEESAFNRNEFLTSEFLSWKSIRIMS